MPQTVEWALHCCWLLAQTDGTAALSRRRLAEFFDLPEPYLAKLLQQLSTGGILRSVPGVNGGYRLARAAETISALDVVQAVQKDSAAFHCAEIRQRGPVGLTSEQCTRPCGIAAVMHRAELAWRSALAGTTVTDMVTAAPPASQQRAARWLGPAARTPREPPQHTPESPAGRRRDPADQPHRPSPAPSSHRSRSRRSLLVVPCCPAPCESLPKTRRCRRHAAAAVRSSSR